MEKIVYEIISSVDANKRVKDCIIGPRSSMVTSLTTGVACNLTHGKNANDLAEAKDTAQGCLGGPVELIIEKMMDSDNMVCRATAIAALNSLIDKIQTVEINGFDILSRLSKGKRIAMVGHFNFTNQLRSMCRHLDVLELEPGPGDLSESCAPDVIPRADIVVITGTACVNGTIDGLLKLVEEAQMVMMLGPSTPMSKVFFEHKVDIVCGVQIDDPGAIVEKIANGASFRDIESWRYATISRDQKFLYELEHI